MGSAGGVGGGGSLHRNGHLTRECAFDSGCAPSTRSPAPPREAVRRRDLLIQAAFKLIKVEPHNTARHSRRPHPMSLVHELIVLDKKLFLCQRCLGDQEVQALLAAGRGNLFRRLQRGRE